jgi:hypothetical protein
LATGNTSGDEVTTRFGAGYGVDTGLFSLEPSAAVAYDRVSRDSWLGLEGGFAEAELRARLASFNGTAPADNGALRRDVIPTGLVYLGQDFGKTWTAKLSCSYNQIDSTIARYQRNDLHYALSITRNF